MRRPHGALLASARETGARRRTGATDRREAHLRVRMDAAPMSTKRKPISRPPRVQITQLAIRLFTEMAALSCTCAARDQGGECRGHEQCAGCTKWWELHARLHHELRCRPWEWPCI